MKTKFFIMIAWLIFLSGCNTLYQSGCYTYSYCEPPSKNINACQCSDPGCGKNSCLSQSACCSIFGNIGSAQTGRASGDWIDP